MPDNRRPDEDKGLGARFFRPFCSVNGRRVFLVTLYPSFSTLKFGLEVDILKFPGCYQWVT